MFKKIILLLICPYLVFFLLENCVRQCDRPENREISGIDFHQDSISTTNNVLRLDFTYESYFVHYESPNLTNKAFANSRPLIIECFDRLLNPVEKISLTSNQDFDSTHKAGDELNTLFYSIFENTRDTLSNRTYDLSQDVNGNRSANFTKNFNSRMEIYNHIKPTKDSIHTLFIEVKFTTGSTLIDSVTNVNLKKVFKN